ncbi:lysoplasmalogenase [Methylibium rhizosphaerae]|jgi:uncharacterized membrane protein YhhN|uniref:lysoplasmalogenase n=1 Tax=Methylibium rhizosphaerae TaxID=2570323 RepID=UPI0015E2BB3C|nr:lysoplasmalogenase [Methylibium rhizosphaerae]
MNESTTLPASRMGSTRAAVWLAVATITCASLTVLGNETGARWLAFVFKPLATVLVIAHAAGSTGDTGVRRRWVLAGLVLSLAGDVALLWPQQGFLPGLVAFLLAHLCYLVAFTRGVRLAAQPLAFAAYALVAGAVLSFLWPGVPAPLQLPVLAYVVALAAMAAQAACWWWHARGSGLDARARLAALGGALFVLSDALLATDKFQGPLPHASVWVLSTYWLAQWLIASSLAAPPRR